MELIVKHESETLCELSTKLEDSDKSLQEFQNLNEYQEQLQKIEDSVNKQEESIMTTKNYNFRGIFMIILIIKYMSGEDVQDHL